jgi:hypothetical protein
MLIFVLGVLFLCPAICFSADFQLSMGREQGGECIKPFDGTVTIRRQPIPFCVVLTNVSSSPRSVYWQSEAGGIASLSFELTPEQGETVVVKRKKTPTRSGQVISDYLAPGATVQKSILTDIDTWENLPIIEPGKVKKIKVRALYNNNGSKIYSDYYTLILDGR